MTYDIIVREDRESMVKAINDRKDWEPVGGICVSEGMFYLLIAKVPKFTEWLSSQPQSIPYVVNRGN